MPGRVYMAGFYTAGGRRQEGTSENAKVLWTLNADHVLESYHYIGKGPVVEFARRDKRRIFLDSGAFSAFTQNVVIDIEEYARFIHRNQDVIEIASNLDAIGGKDSAEQSYKNQKRLEELGCAVIPCHHVRDADSWLQRYLDDGYQHIALGGMVPESKPVLQQWLDMVWDRYLTDADGRPKVKVHGFGMTVTDLILRYPWYSVDSTSWVLSSRMGGISIDLPRPGGFRYLKLAISDQSPGTAKLDAHYDTLAPPVKEAVTKRITELGYDPEGLRTLYAWRDHFNMAFFQRIQAHIPERFIRPQKGLMF